MIVESIHGNILEELLNRNMRMVCPVNAEGSMGAGLALYTRRVVPEVQRTYQERYGFKAPGSPKEKALNISEAQTRFSSYVIFFCSKIRWRDPSPMELVEGNLERLAQWCSKHKIQRMAMPLVGTGLGALKPDDVEKRIIDILDPIQTRISLYLSPGM